MAKTKERLDVLLVERELAESREKAKRIIMAGLVYVDGRCLDKAGQKIDTDLPIELKGDPIPYVSRGGLKLEKAMQLFEIDVTGKVALDIGASTGGFTDCLLQNGATKVFAIDVGYGQLAWKLRQDQRVVVLERTNIRYVTPEMLGELGQVATIDVAFISLTKILAAVSNLLVPGAELISLIKPQFEAGPGQVGKRGIVRDPRVHESVITQVITAAYEEGFALKGLTYSPITGADGNIEFLGYFVKGTHPEDADAAVEPVDPALVEHVVADAWKQNK